MAAITYYFCQNQLLFDDIMREMNIGILEAVDMIYYDRVTREQAEQIKEILGLKEPIDELFECFRDAAQKDENQADEWDWRAHFDAVSGVADAGAAQSE